MFDKFNSFLLFFPELYMAITASSYNEISPEYDNYIIITWFEDYALFTKTQ